MLGSLTMPRMVLLPGGGANLNPGHPFYDAAELLINLVIKVRHFIGLPPLWR